MTGAAGLAAIRDNDYYMANAKTVMENREYTAKALSELGFGVLPSLANFVFAESPDIGGEELYLKLMERGILVRHFTKKRIENFNRITIGALDDMKTLVRTVEEIIKEKRQ